VLEVSAVEAGYGALPVLRGVSLRIGDGEIVAVLGANGAGKSTLINTVSGICRARAGAIRFDGADITRADPAHIVELGLVQVPEGRRVFPNLTVKENLELGSYRRGRPSRARNLDRAREIFPRLAERWGHPAGKLSGGEQQMLAIARGLMAEPRLLVLDEPSLGLSPRLVEEMFRLIQHIHGDGVAVLLVEQNVIQSLALASRAYVLENGVFTIDGPAADLAQDPRLRKAYLGM
jgi:branched-chain amino acid transport system ATP-binding protein